MWYQSDRQSPQKEEPWYSVYLDEDLPDSVDDNDNSDNDDDNDGVGIDEDNNDDDEAGEYVNTSRLWSALQVACSTR